MGRSVTFKSGHATAPQAVQEEGIAANAAGRNHLAGHNCDHRRGPQAEHAEAIPQHTSTTRKTCELIRKLLTIVTSPSSNQAGCAAPARPIASISHARLKNAS